MRLDRASPWNQRSAVSHVTHPPVCLASSSPATSQASFLASYLRHESRNDVMLMDNWHNWVWKKCRAIGIHLLWVYIMEFIKLQTTECGKNMINDDRCVYNNIPIRFACPMQKWSGSVQETQDVKIVTIIRLEVWSSPLQIFGIGKIFQQEPMLRDLFGNKWMVFKEKTLLALLVFETTQAGLCCCVLIPILTAVDGKLTSRKLSTQKKLWHQNEKLLRLKRSQTTHSKIII